MFFPDRSLSREILFLSTNFLSAQSPFEDGIREVIFLPRLVPNKPCVERARACQARACTGAEGIGGYENPELRSFSRTSPFFRHDIGLSAKQRAQTGRPVRAPPRDPRRAASPDNYGGNSSSTRKNRS